MATRAGMGNTASSASGGSSSSSSYPFVLSDEEWRSRLTPEQYRVLRQGGTEAAGKGEYCSYFPKKGHFVCRACSFPLYSAASKFQDAHWDAYSKCYVAADGRPHVHLRAHDEVACNNCGSHLGHVFRHSGEKGANNTGERHCINSVCVIHKNEDPEGDLKEVTIRP